VRFNKQLTFIFVTAIIGLLVLLVIFSYGFNNVITKDELIIKENIQDPELIPFQKDIERLQVLAVSDPEKAEKEGKELLKKLPLRYQEYFKLGFESGIHQLDFYGKIVDQHGVPVIGAKLIYELEGKFLAPGKGFGQVTTDEAGRFEIHGEGGALNLYGMRHPKARLFYPLPSYPITAAVRQSPQNESIRILGHQETKGGENLLWTDTSLDNPHVFTAWRVEDYEKVQSGRMVTSIISDGRVYTYDFTKKDKWGDVVSSPAEGATDGQLRMNCFHDYIRDPQDEKDWSITITAVDGGIQSTDDYYLNMAPESGYQPTIEMGSERNSSEFTRNMFGQRFYFTAKNGQIYGGIYLDIKGDYKPDECGVSIRLFKINTNASRNLALPRPSD
jgi:hypothetical protein